MGRDRVLPGVNCRAQKQQRAKIQGKGEGCCFIFSHLFLRAGDRLWLFSQDLSISHRTSDGREDAEPVGYWPKLERCICNKLYPIARGANQHFAWALFSQSYVSRCAFIYAAISLKSKLSATRPQPVVKAPRTQNGEVWNPHCPPLYKRGFIGKLLSCKQAVLHTLLLHHKHLLIITCKLVCLLQNQSSVKVCQEK